MSSPATLPYALNPEYAGPGGKTGYVYGSICFAMNVVSWFLVPEMKGRTLEEVDQLFDMKIPLRKFKNAKIIPRDPEVQVETGHVAVCLAGAGHTNFATACT